MNIETPALLINKDQLLTNIKDMADYANTYSLRLRPHIKAHRLPQIARLQQDLGASGFTCAKLGEAEMLVNNGMDDVLVAYQLIGQPKMDRLSHLLDQARIAVGCDSMEGARTLQRTAEQYGRKISIYLEIDSGLNRCGVKAGQNAVDLALQIREKCKDLQLVGVFTHAGQAYAAQSQSELITIARQEGESVASTSRMLKRQGFELQSVSVGSTPTAKYAHLVPGVNEIRPGNYVFYDAIQVGLGVATIEQCALSVLTTVISRPSERQVVIDAGSKVLGLDKGAHGIALVNGFGIVLDWSNLTVERLSEEHGVVVDESGTGNLPAIGEHLRIIPNHACPVLYRGEKVYVLDKQGTIDLWPTAIRGSL